MHFCFFFHAHKEIQGHTSDSVCVSVVACLLPVGVTVSQLIFKVILR